MPLNVENKEYVTPDDSSGPKPILHTPKKSNPILKYILQGGFIVIVVASAVFLIYIITLRQLGIEPTVSQETITPSIDTSSLASERIQREETPGVGQPAETAAIQPKQVQPFAEPEKTTAEAVKPEEEIPGVLPKVTLTAGSYTVYIASYITRDPADDEVNRWLEAGYEAMVVEANNHFRVALGQYVTGEDAKIFAGQMWEAFEYGYWIGRVP